MKDIKYIVIHCSDSPDDMNVHAKDIDRWHKERGWNGIGYHFVICRNGNIEKGRAIDVPGAHCYGVNSKSLGICLIGRKNFTEEQFISLYGLCTDLKFEYPGATIKGHHFFNKRKTCPNFKVLELLGKDLCQPSL